MRRPSSARPSPTGGPPRAIDASAIIRAGLAPRLGLAARRCDRLRRSEALQRFAEVVRDFINTYEHNMNKRPGQGRFERIVYADDGLREELMPAFETLYGRHRGALYRESKFRIGALQIQKN